MKYSSPSKGVRFNGGKGKCRGLVAVINSLLPENAVYHEPFCGSCKVVQSVRAARRIATDADPYIICLLKAVQRGWDPPSSISEAEYDRLHDEYRAGRGRAEYVYPLIAFAGYACSFGARFFEGYARSKKRTVNFAESGRTSLLRQRPFLEGVELAVADYRDPPPINPDVIYCDPPYQGTKDCGSVKGFDSVAFWDWAVKAARRSTVLVSEYQCPIPDAVVLWEKDVAAGLRFGTKGDGGEKGDGRRKREKLFCLTPSAVRDVGLGLI